MNIRRAMPEDAPVLTEIALAAKCHWGYPERWIVCWRDLLTITPDFIARHETHAAVVGDRIVGFCALGSSGPRLELTHLWVRPERIRHGVGRALFLHALARVRALGFGELVIESDPNAEGFYRRMGARRVRVSLSQVDGQQRELPVLVCPVGGATDVAGAAQMRRCEEEPLPPSPFAYEKRMPRHEEANRLVVAGRDVSGREVFLTPETAQAWHAMSRAAVADGVHLLLLSGFRSVRRQTEIIQAKLAKGLSLETILRVSAYPGHSEHHTGLAVDVGSPHCEPLSAGFERTPEFAWMDARAPGFRFRLSFPRGNPHGIEFEPWHWRHYQQARAAPG